VWIPTATSLRARRLSRGQNPSTIVPVLYFLTAACNQVRFDVSTESVVSMYCWKSRTSSQAMRLWKCTSILVLSFWLKSHPRDLVSWPQKFFHQTTSILCMNVYVWSSFSDYMPYGSIVLVYPRTSSYGPNFHSLIGQISLMTNFTSSPISDQESSALPCGLTLPCECWVIIVKPYRIVPRFITSWPLIISSSLKPMVNFICLIHPLQEIWHSITFCFSHKHMFLS
jgi:hypothetical protein